MNIHEFQAKQIFREAAIPVPRGEAVTTPQQAREAAARLGGSIWVVKAQIHAGGRGKAGGVKIAKSLDEVESLTRAMLGMTLVTHQTGPQGKEVLRVLVEEGIDIKKEFYIGIALDRASGRDVMMASTEGGVEIEEVAHRSPEKIIRAKLSPAYGLDGYAARKLAFALGLKGKTALEAASVMSKLAQVYRKTDASLMEINPFVIKGDGGVVALDAKMNFDDNGLFRQKQIGEMRDLSEEDPKETEARKWELSYIALDGNIGCMVNGAGLAMATLDTINYFGGSPANFLDVGGGAQKDQVTAAFKIILADPKVKGILVNIFGGIMRCDVIAAGVIAAAREVGVKVPLVVRLEGTNVEIGRKLIAESGLNLIAANSLAEAAKKVVAAVKAK